MLIIVRTALKRGHKSYDCTLLIIMQDYKGDANVQLPVN